MRTGPLFRRALLVCVLLGVLFGTFVAYGSLGPASDRNVYPDHRDLADDYDRYVGDRVVVSGEVVSTDPLVVAASDGRGGEIEYRIVRTSKRPAVGENLRVFGVANPGRVIVTQDGFVVDSDGSTYAYGVSLLAGGWVFGRLVRRWRLDPDAGLVRRDQPLWLPLGVGRQGTLGADATDDATETDDTTDGGREVDDA